MSLKIEYEDLKNDDIVWAISYPKCESMDRAIPKLYPVRGIISSCGSKLTSRDEYGMPYYFIPYKKDIPNDCTPFDAESFAYSRSVSTKNRDYARTEANAYELLLEQMMEYTKRNMQDVIDKMNKTLPPDIVRDICDATGVSNIIKKR